MSAKSEFIRSLQLEPQALSPYDISQRVRLKYGFVSTYQGDSDLDVDHFRGYMVKHGDKPHRTAEDPELYTCVISLNQSRAWQEIVWIKEILQILDSEEHRTNTAEKLGHMLDSRRTNSPNGASTPPNVLADKAGFTLALGSAVPHAYREVLREQDFLGRFLPDVT